MNQSRNHHGMSAKMKRVRIFLALVLILGVAAGGWWWYSNEEVLSADRLTLYGNADIREVDLAFNGSERITKMHFEEGDVVTMGQLVATLATARLEAMVARAEAEVAAQRQVVVKLEAGTRIEEINKTRAELQVAEALARDAGRSLNRIKDLAASKLASPQQVDDARAAADSAAARVKAAKASLELALAGPRVEDIAAARATLKAREAQLTLARRELEDTSLYAPCDGVIRNRILEPGDMASPQRPVYTLALSDPIWIRAYVDEPDLGKIRPGMSAQLTTDSFPDKTYQGWIGYISPTAEFTPKSVQTAEVRTSLVYQVRVFVDNPQNELRLGMPATVIIDLKQPVSHHGATGRCNTVGAG
jgi:HlyD family secretion protein